MTNDLLPTLPDGDPSVSFYLTEPSCHTGTGLDNARTAARLAGSLTIAGPKGPAKIHRLRALGIDVPIYYDGEGYKRTDLPRAEEWVHTQLTVGGAAQAFLPGIFLDWNDGDHSKLVCEIQEQARIAAGTGAAMLLATDVRWIAKEPRVLIDTLGTAAQAVGIVLAHGGDPLSLKGAIPGLQALATSINRLSLLRCDQAAVGAIAFGAQHGSIGLTTSTRHYATRAMKPRKQPDNSPRLYSLPDLDWFMASHIAGWAAAGADFTCRLPCCNGGSLARFLHDSQFVATHNMTSLAYFARKIIDAEPTNRAAIFVRCCREATSRYGIGGFQVPVEPKAQLTGWALS